MFLRILLIVSIVCLTQRIAFAQPAEKGQLIFQQKCASCHTIGGGTLVGPDLKGVTIRRDRGWLVHWILTPDKMLAERDPIATELLQKFNNVPMPNLGLSETDAASVLAYLETSTAEGALASQLQAPVPALPPGNPIIGKNLFMGIVRFQNGGPPCMGCHSIAGIGALGGGALGPDLTPAFNKYGENGLTIFLTTMPLPTMNAVWARQPLTLEEQANLRDFLKQASVSGRSIQALGQLAALALGGTVVLLAIAQIYWRGRLTGVRQPLVVRKCHTRKS